MVRRLMAIMCAANIPYRIGSIIQRLAFIWAVVLRVVDIQGRDLVQDHMKEDVVAIQMIAIKAAILMKTFRTPKLIRFNLAIMNNRHSDIKVLATTAKLK